MPDYGRKCCGVCAERTSNDTEYEKKAQELDALIRCSFPVAEDATKGKLGE
jgi:hypothetical protein